MLALNAVHLSVILMMSRTVAKEFGRKEALILAKNLRVTLTGTALDAMCIISGTLHGVRDCDSTRQLEVTAQGHGVTDASASTRSMAAALTV